MPALDIGAVQLHYWEVGPVDAPAIVILHAMGARADDWREIADALADRWHVIALDQRGHGQSSRPGTYSFELLRDDLVQFIDALKLERPTLIAHSMGGTVAYLYAAAFPARLDRLVAIDTPPPFPAHFDEPAPPQVPADL